MSESRLKVIEYKNGGHGYTIDGRRAPGVTTIINQTSPAKGLLGWYAEIAANWAVDHIGTIDEIGRDNFIASAKAEPNAEAGRRGDRGRDIHAAAYALAAGEAIDVPPDIAQAARLVVDWFDKWGVEILARELPVWHSGHRYAGQFDLIAKLSDGQRWLVDYKSGNYVMAGVALQLAAYRNAEFIVWDGTDRPMPQVDQTGVLHIRDNSWEFLPVDTGPEVWSAFLNSLPLYRFHGTKYGYDRIGQPLPVPEAAPK